MSEVNADTFKRFIKQNSLIKVPNSFLNYQEDGEDYADSSGKVMASHERIACNDIYIINQTLT